MTTSIIRHAIGSLLSQAHCVKNLTTKIKYLVAAILTVFSWGTLLPASAQGVVNEQNLSDAILQNQVFSPTELDELDMNFDGRVDVADLVFFLSGAQIPLDGYQWLVSATFAPSAGNQAQLSYGYEFALTVTDTGATVSSLKVFNPTKGLLRQKLSGPGDVPGALRPDYAPTAVVPVGTTFSVSPTANGFELTSSAISIGADNPINPTNKTLTRSLLLTVSTTDAFSAAASHGTIVDQLSGFAPSGGVSSSSGTVRITRYSPNVLAELEDPRPPSNTE